MTETEYRTVPVYPEAPEKIRHYQEAFDTIQEYRGKLSGMLLPSSYFGFYCAELKGDYYSIYEEKTQAWLEELKTLCDKVTDDFDLELQSCQAEAQRLADYWRQLSALRKRVPI